MIVKLDRLLNRHKTSS